MENLINKSKNFLNAFAISHPLIHIGNEKSENLYMAYHDLKNAIKEQEESGLLQPETVDMVKKILADISRETWIELQGDDKGWEQYWDKRKIDNLYNREIFKK